MLPNLGKYLGGSYYGHARPEIMHLVPLGARRLLDLGCGHGQLGAAVKARQDCHYTGIEHSATACKVAEKHIDKAIPADLNAYNPGSDSEDFDCIIFADVLEHLIDPLSVLKKFSRHLSPGGVIVASLPNVAHPRIVRELASNLFRYVPAGILDASHFRFFTSISAQQLFVSAGLRVTQIIPFPSAGNPHQFLFTLELAPSFHERKALTVLIPTFNTLDVTRECITSLRQSLHKNLIILVFDNGSKDKTLPWLRAQPDVLTISSPGNLGFPVAVNLMLNCITTPYFLISNSDALYPPQSIPRLLDCIYDLGERACVGPSASFVSGPQKVNPFPGETWGELCSWSEAYHENCSAAPALTHRLVFFSFLAPTRIISDVGLLNEIFTPGNFEDDDYCLRAIQAGYSLYHIPSIYVHHYGHSTFKRNSIDINSVLRRNQGIFHKIWPHTLYAQIIEKYYEHD